MEKPEFEQFGVTKEQCGLIYAKRGKILNYVFGISSAAGILTGSIAGVYISQGMYETVLFVLFFGCFLGSIFGAVFTILTVKLLYTLYLYIFSHDYRNCRRYFAAKARYLSETEKRIY